MHNGETHERPRRDEHSLAGRLTAAIHQLPPHDVTVGEIRDVVGRDGLMLLVAVLTLVFMVPVSIPGLSTVFGAAILLVGLSRVRRRELWLPRRIVERPVPADRLRKSLERGVAVFRRLERLSRPNRLSWAATGPAEAINDAAIVIGALLLIAPFGFIPFSNTLPALALLFLAIGSLQRDGVCAALGHCALVVTAAYFVVLITGGGVAFVAVIDRVFR